MSGERRRNPRYAVDAPARLIVEGVPLDGRVKDICRDAVLVEAERIWPLGTPVSVTLTLSSQGVPLEVRGSVIRISEEQEHPGMAILFTDLTPELATRIDVWIAQRD